MSRAGTHRKRPRIKTAAEQALISRLRELHVPLDGDGRAEHLRQVVVDTVSEAALGQALGDIRQGSGGELAAKDGRRPKFHSAFSSCGLAVNAFGPWRVDAAELSVEGQAGFEELRFEVKRPIFTWRATPPNLDVIATNLQAVVAVESKLTEYLGGNERASFADRYDEAAFELADESWREMYSLLRVEPRRFAFLNADQLVKHYLGLRRTQGEDGPPAILVYLYWESSDASSYEAFAHHRAEIAEFNGLVSDVRVTFTATSYVELWHQWESRRSPSWLGEHLSRLRERYDVPLDP